MMTRGLLTCLLALFLAGCGESRLLPENELAQFNISDGQENRIVYYRTIYQPTLEGRVQATTHSVLRVGRNAHTALPFVGVFDGPMERLTAFEARILHRDGSKETYGKGDLASATLTGSRQINENSLKYLHVTDYLEEGSLVEQVYTQEMPLAPLGSSFLLSDLGGEGENIACSYRVTPRDTLAFHVVNDSLSPEIIHTPAYTEYTFRWPRYVPLAKSSSFSKSNKSPGVLVAFGSAPSAGNAPPSWVSFGDWYLSLIEKQLVPDEAIKATVKELTAGKTTDLEKLRAIARYCQTRIRYEQVYLAHGEIIPNAVSSVFASGYGDCKDYSSLLFSMARAAGIETRLVLCHRGRGFEIHPEVPVSQFNHMIVHFSDHGRDYWLDGTNRAGTPGVTTSDLIGSSALVLQRGASRMVTIQRDENTVLRVRGSLQATGVNLDGNLDVSLEGQYAVDFLGAALYRNPAALKEMLIDFLKTSLNPAIVVRDLKWRQGVDTFTVTASCRLPGALTIMGANTYVSLWRLFPALLPPDDPRGSNCDMLFYPGYEQADVAVDLPEFQAAADSAAHPGPFRCTGSIAMRSGLSAGRDREAFITTYQHAVAASRKTINLVRRNVP